MLSPFKVQSIELFKFSLCTIKSDSGILTSKVVLAKAKLVGKTNSQVKT
jgi:hypothetical protein